MALLLLLAYGLPLFFPPAAAYPAPPAADAGIWQRIFPDVPTWWVVGRLVCLGAGAGLLALYAGPQLPLRLSGVGVPAADSRGARSPLATVAEWAALLLALAHAIASLYVARFNRLGETAYFLFLGVPGALLGLMEIGSARRMLRSRLPRLMTLCAVPVLWLTCCLPNAWRSPRSASIVDGWFMVQRLSDVVAGAQSAFVDAMHSGYTNAYALLEGLPFLSVQRLPLVFVWLQIAHAFWGLVCAIVVGVLAWRLVGFGAAIVAQAVFLFSPYVFSFPYDPTPIFLGPLCTGILMLLLLAVHEGRSAAALAVFGGVAGYSGRIPQLSLITFLLCALLAYSLLRSWRIPWLAVATAAFSCVAAALPGLPTAKMITAAVATFTTGRNQVAGAVLSFFGQWTPLAIEQALNAGRSAPLDVPIGALLAPFAITRTPMRLWGDTLFDPFGAMLLATGLILCVRCAARNRGAVLLLAVLATGSATALTSGADAVSHTRLAPALVPLALLAGIGFETLCRVLPWKVRPKALVATIATLSAIGGVVVFDRVNAEILPASWLTISLEALGPSEPNADAVFLELGWGAFSFLHVDRIAALLPTRPLPAVGVCGFEPLQSAFVDAPRRLYFWNPGLEQDVSISCAVCDRWPGAALYTLKDGSRLFRAFAASPRGESWQPQLPSDRWSVSFCQAHQDAEAHVPSMCEAPLCRAYDITQVTASVLDTLRCGPPAG